MKGQQYCCPFLLWFHLKEVLSQKDLIYGTKRQ